MSTDPYVSSSVVSSPSPERASIRWKPSALFGAARSIVGRVASLFRGDAPSPSAGYRRLALQLEHDLGAEGKRSILIVSAERSPLRSHAAAAIANTLAEVLGTPVLLADADPDGGVTDLLGGAASSSIQRTSHEKLAFLPHQALAVNGGDVDRTVRELESAHGFVVFSGGVVTDLSSLRLAPLVGQVLVLAFEHATRKEEIAAARETLRRCGAARVGVVLTRSVSATG